MRKLSIAVTLTAAMLTVVAAAAAGPTDLWNDHESGDTQPLKSGVTYRASLFPVAITFRTTDKLWQGGQDVHTSGLHDGRMRNGAKYAFVSLLHTYAHDAQGKVTNWGRGTITLEASFTRSASVQTTMDRLRARHDDFQTASDVRPTHIAGFTGLSFDGRLKDRAGGFHRFIPFSSADGSVPTTDSKKLESNYGKGNAFRVVVLNVKGSTVVIYLDSETAPPDKFPVFLGFANRLFATLKVSQ